MARKLFPSYGSALANNLLAALERQRVVGAFVAAYVTEYNRQGILGGPSRDRELAETIGRESMLAMIHEARQSLPHFFGKRKSTALRTEEKEALDVFFRELIAALERAWNWDKEDRRQFQRDLGLYSGCTTSKVRAGNVRKRGKVQALEPPFVGRVALLLDPSMLDQARQAARRFYLDVGRLTQKILRQTLRPNRR